MDPSPSKPTQSNNAALLELVRELSGAVVYSDASNVTTNRKLWDNYSADWKEDAGFVTKMASNLPDQPISDRKLHYLGDEWSTKSDLSVVLEDFFYPYTTPETTALELGSGGGRVANCMATHVKTLTCCDISAKMLERAQSALTHHNNISFTLLKHASLESTGSETMDFVYAFDVFPHVGSDLHTIRDYIREFRRVVKVGGYALVHTANMISPLGWKRFEAQKEYSVGGFYFVSPEIVTELIRRIGGFKIIKESSVQDKRSMYYQRDYIILLQRVSPS